MRQAFVITGADNEATILVLLEGEGVVVLRLQSTRRSWATVILDKEGTDELIKALSQA